jgi:hypothetical protein
MRARRLVHFLTIGAVLFAARRALSDDELATAPLRVEVGADSSPGEVRTAVDEAMLVDVALRAGWARTDPVIRDRLIRNMRFAGANGDDDALLDRALRIGMARRDPVARQRLIDNARSHLTQRTTPEPTTKQLEAYRRDHSERFTRPGKLRVHQVFVSAQRHGPDLQARAAEIGRRLEQEGLSPSRAAALSDPILLGTDLGWVDARRLEGSLGGDVAEALTRAPTQQWTGPIRSAFGLHFFWTEARRSASLPPLRAIAAEVRQAWRKDAETHALRAALDRLRGTYDVEVVR